MQRRLWLLWEAYLHALNNDKFTMGAALSEAGYSSFNTRYVVVRWLAQGVKIGVLEAIEQEIKNEEGSVS